MYDGVSSVISAVDLIANGIRIRYVCIRNVEDLNISLSFRVDYCVDNYHTS